MSLTEAAQVILKEEGVGALYQGWWSSVVSLGISNFVYFYVYNAGKVLFMIKMARTTVDPVTNLAIASVAGVINVLATSPLYTVGTRLTTQKKKQAPKAGSDKKDTGYHYKGLFDGLCTVARDEGFWALWKGVGSSLMLVSNPTIVFVVYEQLRTRMEAFAKSRGNPITAFEFFIIGAISKAVATVATYPLQVAQSKMRADKGKDDGTGKFKRQYSGTINCLTQILNSKDGIAGWFRGMGAKLWQTVLTAAFMFMCYEEIAAVVFRFFRIKRAIKK